MRTILIACVGNICRSPMAEALLSHRAKQLNISLTVSSAGINALSGHACDETAQIVMKQHNIDGSKHYARQLTSKLILPTELILVMQNWHIDAVTSIEPTSRGKVYRLGHWLNEEIEDPYRKPYYQFQAAWDQIDRSIDSWVEKLWPEAVRKEKTTPIT